MSLIKIIEKKDNQIWLKISGLPIQYANAIRRICLNSVPIMAIDEIDVIENTSILTDEGLAHRLAMIPLKTDLSRFVEHDLCECGNDIGCSNCRVLLVLDSKGKDETYTVMSNELISDDPDVKPISNNIPLAVLAPEQKIKLEAYARLGRGTEHAKWNSANVAVLKPSKKKGEFILMVESTQSLEPLEIVNRAVKELSDRIKDFKTKLEGLSTDS